MKNKNKLVAVLKVILLKVNPFLYTKMKIKSSEVASSSRAIICGLCLRLSFSLCRESTDNQFSFICSIVTEKH